MDIRDFKDLIVWQKSMYLVEKIYILTKEFPKEELYSLTNQIRRASISVPSNIAEGQQRSSSKEFANFLSIAKGSNAEVQTQLIIASRLGYVKNEQIDEIIQLSNEITKMLNSIISKLESAN